MAAIAAMIAATANFRKLRGVLCALAGARIQNRHHRIHLSVNIAFVTNLNKHMFGNVWNGAGSGMATGGPHEGESRQSTNKRGRH